MITNSTISIVLPAFNEEANLKGTVDEVLMAMDGRFRDYELVVVDDGSTDRTGEIANSLAGTNPRIRVLHNGVNRGFGFSYRRGVQAATCDYVGFFPTDDCVPSQSMEAIFDQVGKADIIVNFTSNPEIRRPVRRVISRAYTRLINVLFGLRLNYVNGPTVHRREVIQAVKVSTDGFALFAEVMVRLIRSGHSYLEIGIPIRERKQGGVKAFKPKNVVSVLKTVCFLFWDVNVMHRKEYNQLGRPVPDQPVRQLDYRK